MPFFILAGHQRSLGPQVKKALEIGEANFNGWSGIPFAGNQRSSADIGAAQVCELLRLAEQHEGAPIFGVSAQKTRNKIEDAIKPYFRFRWVAANAVGPVGGGDNSPLIDALTAATMEENYWLNNVKPKSSASPLILPEIFRAKKELADLWRLANSYNKLGHLEAAKKRIEKFTEHHRKRTDGFKSTPWQDDDSWIWDDDGERHGDPVFPEYWKYSLRLPDGFHFDVSTLVKGKTFFTDKHNRRHTLKKHLNITAHGEVRGANVDR